MKLVILGRLPQLSLAELVSLFGAQVTLFNRQVATLAAEQADLSRLGGSLKLARVIAELPTTSLDEIRAAVRHQATELIPSRDGKQAIGVSIYSDQHLPQDAAFRLGLELKSKLKPRSIRIVPSTANQLSSAQVLHNRLTSGGIELTIAVDRSSTLIGRTEAIQDIEAYGARDQARPARDPRVGMLPPKLAQIMINLANPPAGSLILDPFCGSGVLLQEALLLGFRVYGSDLDPKMVAASRTNLQWLSKLRPLASSPILRLADATRYQWNETIGAIVTESYLGPPLRRSPQASKLRQLQAEASRLTLDFLRNLQPQLVSQTPVIIALPAWKTRGGYGGTLGLSPGNSLIDQIAALGYTLKRFRPVTDQDLIYFRPGQIVARQILALTRV